MMIDINQAEKIKEILVEIVDILKKSGDINRFPGLLAGLRYIEGIIEDPFDVETIKGLKSIIKGMYGGMGTFGDLVLGKGYKFTEEDKVLNERLYNLKSQLYKLVDEL